MTTARSGPKSFLRRALTKLPLYYPDMVRTTLILTSLMLPLGVPAQAATAPPLRPDSTVAITLERTECFGRCPAYTVTISTADGIVFDGRRYVVATGKHTDQADAKAVRVLAQRFVAAGFYSMNANYHWDVTDSPYYILTIAIDGHANRVEDYVGQRAGMPAIVTALEHDVDALARTQRWIDGSDGLVPALQAERFNFQTFQAQVMLKESASRGQTATVREFLKAGVPLKPMPTPKSQDPDMEIPFEGVGWLNAASSRPETLQVLIQAGASKRDQTDKDLALMAAARAGNVASARELIAYGANPNADVSKLTIIEHVPGIITFPETASGSVLINAAKSGNPEMVREILRYHPNLNLRDHDGETALSAVEQARDGIGDSARAECVRLLTQSGAKQAPASKPSNKI